MGGTDCFDLGEGGECKSSQYFCIKCTTGLRKDTLFWDKDSAHTYGGVGCNDGKSTKCRHMVVDKDQELERSNFCSESFNFFVFITDEAHTFMLYSNIASTKLQSR